MSSSVVIYTGIFIAFLISFDLSHAWRNRNKVTSAKAASTQVLLYVTIAILFGVLMRSWTSPEAQASYFASWITEYSLSLDNLFVFIILFKKLRVPQEKQEMSLFFGITLSLVLRAICLIAGVALLHKFAFINFGFAALLAYTAYQMKNENGNDEEEKKESELIQRLGKFGIHGFQLALYSIAITDLMFAFDSIPAVLGGTNDIYVILTSNFMALMGLRQLYFIVERLVSRLYYLTTGIMVILFFISFKLLSSALLNYKIEKIFGLKVPHVSTEQSLIFICTTLFLATILSLLKKDSPTS